MPHAEPTRKPAVLIVDADGARREALVAALTERRFETRGVVNEFDAVLALRRVDFDVVVVSGPDPVVTLRLIRPAAGDARILVVGQCPDWQTCVELAALGAMDVVKRTESMDELARRLRRILPPEGAAA